MLKIDPRNLGYGAIGSLGVFMLCVGAVLTFKWLQRLDMIAILGGVVAMSGIIFASMLLLWVLNAIGAPIRKRVNPVLKKIGK